MNNDIILCSCGKKIYKKENCDSYTCPFCGEFIDYSRNNKFEIYDENGDKVIVEEKDGFILIKIADKESYFNKYNAFRTFDIEEFKNIIW